MANYYHQPLYRHLCGQFTASNIDLRIYGVDRQTWEIIPPSMNPVSWQIRSVYYDSPINRGHSTPDLIPVVFAWIVGYIGISRYIKEYRF